MTEEEKKRLDDLLKDVDNIPDIPEVQEDAVSTVNSEIFARILFSRIALKYKMYIFVTIKFTTRA